jgi:hypothetical protein
LALSGHGWTQRPRVSIQRSDAGQAVSGHPDRRVRSARVLVSRRGNDSISCEGLINSPWLAWAHSLGHLHCIYTLVSLAKTLTHLAWLDHHFDEIESIQVHYFEWLHLEALGDCISLWISLITLGGYCHLDSLVQWGSLSGGRWLAPAPTVVIVMGSWPFPGGEPKGTLVDCSWLVDPHLVLVVRHPIAG